MNHNKSATVSLSNLNKLVFVMQTVLCEVGTESLHTKHTNVGARIIKSSVNSPPNYKLTEHASCKNRNILPTHLPSNLIPKPITNNPIPGCPAVNLTSSTNDLSKISATTNHQN